MRRCNVAESSKGRVVSEDADQKEDGIKAPTVKDIRGRDIKREGKFGVGGLLPPYKYQERLNPNRQILRGPRRVNSIIARVFIGEMRSTE